MTSIVSSNAPRPRSPAMFYVLVLLTAGLFAPAWLFLLCRDANAVGQRRGYRLYLIGGGLLVLVVLVVGWILIIGSTGVIPLRPGPMVRALIRYENLAWLLLIPLAVSLQRRIDRGLGREPRIGGALTVIVLSFLWMTCLPYLQSRLNRWIDMERMPAAGSAAEEAAGQVTS